MSFADTLGAERLASQYFLTRLGQVRYAQNLSASEQFDLARSPLSDDELEDVVDQFRDAPAPRSGWGLSEVLNEVVSREPKRIPTKDLEALQKNLIAQGYVPPDKPATGTWDPSWYAAFRRWDRDNMDAQRAGRHWYSAPVESGVRALTNTLPSRVFQGIVGAAKGIVTQTPETLERGGLLGGAAAGAGIGAAAGSVLPGVGTAVGAAGGAVIGGVGGFLLDLFGEDPGEEDQSGAERLLDALQPFNEYAQQGPKAFFEDLGYVLSTASVVSGVGAAARGVVQGARALQAARTLPELTGAPPAGAAMGGAPWELANVGASPAPASLAKAALFRPPVNNELGVFGSIVRAATRKYVPGSMGALEQTMLKYSPIAFGQRLGPNIALKAFGGVTQAQMGARLFGGIGQDSRGKLDEAKTALEAELGRSLTFKEVTELEKKTGQTAIEKAIANAPELRTGVEVPLLGDLVDVAAFVLYPQHLLPFRGTKVAKSAVNLMGDTSLAPFAHAVQHQNPSLTLKQAVSQVKGWLTPIDNAWLRADYGIHRESHRIIQAARLSPEKAFRSNAIANARADVIRSVRREYSVSGRSETLERVMRYSIDTVEGVDGPTDFTGWLVELNGQHRGLDRLAAWRDANKMARKIEREVKANTRYDVVGGKRIASADLPVEERWIPYETAEGTIKLPERSQRVAIGGVSTQRAGTNVDRMVLVDRIEHLEKLAKRYDNVAGRSASDPFSSMAARERARLARAEAETLKKQLVTLKAADQQVVSIDRFAITPARLEFADRATLFAKRREYNQLRREVLTAVEAGNKPAEVIARQRLGNYVDELAQQGIIPDELVKTAKTAKPGERIPKLLERQAQSAARTIELPEQYMREFERLGYKPVQTGDDILFPDQLKEMVEVSGIGDYTRRAQVWETLGLSPKWRSDRGLFRLRREHEISELEQVFRENGVKLNGEQAMKRLHQRLESINHDGAVLGPFIRSEGKTRLYKVDVRDLSPDDVLRAFEDVPGVNEDVAHQIFGALRRGAAYGGELKMLRPKESVLAIAKSMRLNGLPGFSDVVRTWHSDVPRTFTRGQLRREEFNYRPITDADPAFDVAHSVERARIDTSLKEVASRTKISEGQRQFGMMLLDSQARSQVRAGRFASVDDFFRHVDIGYAEKYVAEGQDALFKRVWTAPSMKQLERLLAKVGDTPGWYEESGRAIAQVFGGIPVTLENGATIDAADLVTQIIAVTSGGAKPNANMTFALNDLRRWLVGGEVKGGRYGKNQVPLIKAILSGDHMGVNPGRWQKYEPFRHALLGDLDAVVIDRRMKFMFGLAENITPGEQEWAEGIVRGLAERTGLAPRVVQERLWVGFGDWFDDLAKKARRSGDTELAGTFQELADGVRTSDANLSYADLLENPGFGKYLESANEVKAGLLSREDMAARQVMTVAKQVEDEVLAVTQFGEDMRATLRFFRNADFSTLIHEEGHLLRRLLPDEDLAVIEKAYGVPSLHEVAPEFTPVPLDAAKGSRFTQAAEEIRTRTLDLESPSGGGATWDPHTGRFVEGGKPGAGAAVAVNEGTSLTVDAARAAEDPKYWHQQLSKFIRQNKEALENPDVYVGTWNDREGMIHLDVSEVIPDKRRAQMLGELRKQKKVFDLETLEDVDTLPRWSREAEEAFAGDAERYFLQGVVPGKARGSFDVLREGVASLWRSSRPYWGETNAVSRDVRRLFDKSFEDVMKKMPERHRGVAAVKTLATKQPVIGAGIGGAMGALEGDDPGDILRGVALGAGVGLAGRAALKRTYGYLPDYLTRVNTALRYTLSFTFDAGRYTEQNMIAMAKHRLPAMLSPTKYIKAREWRSPFTNGVVKGDSAWRDAVKLWDEINGTSWFQNIDDLDRRMFQAGMLGFSPRNWEVAQAFQLYQRGMGANEIRQAISEIGRYGLGRTAAEKSANFVVFPFSFSKKLITTLGDFVLQAPARNLLIHEGLRRYHESEFDDKVNDFLERHAPLLKQLWMINNLAYGISPGRFFLQGLQDQRTGPGKIGQILASVFVPSGAATPLAQAAGGLGDLAVHAFTPIVITGESINRGGGMDPITEIMRRYVPFVRELDQYFLGENAAVRAQLTAIKEGAEPYYQFQKYQDELKASKAGYEGLAVALGYSGIDGLLQSNLGMGIQGELEKTQMELAQKYPTGFQMSQQFENSDLIDQRALLDLAEKVSAGHASQSEERILMLAEDEQRFETLKQILGVPPELVDAMAAKSIRSKAAGWVSDTRFAELYDRFFTRTYGPIRRVA